MKRVSAPADGAYKRYKMPDCSLQEWIELHPDMWRAFLNGFLSGEYFCNTLSWVLDRPVGIAELEAEAVQWIPWCVSLTDQQSRFWVRRIPFGGLGEGADE